MKILAFAVLAMTAFGATEGNPKSRVRVIAYESLQCSDCAVYRKMLDEHLLPKYGDRVAFEHRDFPLPKHNWSRPAAVAARYFDSLGRKLGTEFRRWVLNNIAVVSAENFEQKLAAWARSHGAEPDKAVASLKNEALAKAVEEDYQEGIARGVARTPTVFVNGEPFIETFTLEAISKSIDAALAATGK